MSDFPVRALRCRWRWMPLSVAFALAMALLLAGCASIPLSTAMRLASSEPGALMRTDPGDLRVKVSVPADFELDVERTRLSVAVRAEDGASRSAELPLRLLQQLAEERPGGMFRSAIPVSTYLLSLTGEGAQQLREVQEFAVLGQKYVANLSVNTPLAKTPPDPQEIIFWVDLLLGPDQSWMPLINRARLKMENTEEEAEASGA